MVAYIFRIVNRIFVPKCIFIRVLYLFKNASQRGVSFTDILSHKKNNEVTFEFSLNYEFQHGTRRTGHSRPLRKQASLDRLKYLKMQLQSTLRGTHNAIKAGRVPFFCSHLYLFTFICCVCVCVRAMYAMAYRLCTLSIWVFTPMCLGVATDDDLSIIPNLQK